MTLRKRAGYTLIELLVVISIIAVLIGLLLPAVQKIREAAARLQCSNNMKQLALGVMNYETTHKALPPSGQLLTWANPAIPLAAGANDNGLRRLLPFVEQETLYNQFDGNFMGGYWDPSTDTPQPASTVLLSVFQCPSDPSEDSMSNGAGKSNYDFVVNVPDTAVPNTPDPPSLYPRYYAHSVLTKYQRYAFFETNPIPNQAPRPTKIVEIRNGSSNTLMFVEVTQSFVDPVTGLAPGPLSGLPFGYRNMPGADPLGFNRWYVDPSTNTPLVGTLAAPGLAGSTHAGVVNVAALDGSVHSIAAADISPQVLFALCTINGQGPGEAGVGIPD